MFEKIKNVITHPYTQQLKDVRVLGLLVFCIIALLVTYSGLGAIQTNYVLQKQIARIEQENQIRELENNNLRLTNEYFNTDQYLELQARRQFGKAAPGETVVLVPRNVALHYTVDTPKDSDATQQDKPHKPAYQRNFEAWMDFFFRSSES